MKTQRFADIARIGRFLFILGIVVLIASSADQGGDGGTASSANVALCRWGYDSVCGAVLGIKARQSREGRFRDPVADLDGYARIIISLVAAAIFIGLRSSLAFP